MVKVWVPNTPGQLLGRLRGGIPHLFGPKVNQDSNPRWVGQGHGVSWAGTDFPPKKRWANGSPGGNLTFFLTKVPGPLGTKEGFHHCVIPGNLQLFQWKVKGAKGLVR